MGLIEILAHYTPDEAVDYKLLDHILTSAQELDDVLRSIVKEAEQVDRLEL